MQFVEFKGLPVTPGRAVSRNQLTLFEERDGENEWPWEIDGDDHAYLRRRDRPLTSRDAPTLRGADLFSGCGGLSLGVREACSAAGVRFVPVLAADFDRDALAAYCRNFDPALPLDSPIEASLDGGLGSPFTPTEKKLRRRVGSIDVLLGGPPCQGHSDLNNYTRRSDPKNSLYLRMARAAALFRPRFILIENVPGSIHDRGGAVQTARAELDRLGYQSELLSLNGLAFGIPQGRKRLALVATMNARIDWEQMPVLSPSSYRTVRWATEDLQGVNGDGLLDEPATSAPETRRRIEYLFRRGLFDLPNSERPPCHRDRSHSYKSIYGRLRWDQPAQTITSGFFSMCMGRYVHPEEPRTLTAHEAARLQFFPDSFDLGSVSSRTKLATIIGNAVPPKFSYVLFIKFLAESGLWHSSGRGNP